MNSDQHGRAAPRSCFEALKSTFYFILLMLYLKILIEQLNEEYRWKDLRVFFVFKPTCAAVRFIPLTVALSKLGKFRGPERLFPIYDSVSDT